MIRALADAVLGENKSSVWRYIVSGVASGIGMLVTSFTCRALGMSDGFATISGVLVSFVVSFVLQKWWVFRSGTPVTIASIRFAVVTATTWLLSLGLYQLLVNVFAWPFAAVQVAIVCFVAACNFTINRLWTFRERKAD